MYGGVRHEGSTRRKTKVKREEARRYRKIEKIQGEVKIKYDQDFPVVPYFYIVLYAYFVYSGFQYAGLNKRSRHAIYRQRCKLTEQTDVATMFPLTSRARAKRAMFSAIVRVFSTTPWKVLRSMLCTQSCLLV